MKEQMKDELIEWMEDRAYTKGQIAAYNKMKEQLIEAKEKYESVVGKCGYTSGLSRGIEIADDELAKLKGVSE